MAAVLFDLLGDKKGTEFFAKMSTASHGSERDEGHTGNFFNLTWAMPGVSRCGPHATGAWMEEFGAWYFDLNRQLGLEFPLPRCTKGTHHRLQWLGHDRRLSDRLRHAPEGDPAHRQETFRHSASRCGGSPSNRHGWSWIQHHEPVRCLRSASSRHVARAAHQLVADRPRESQPLPRQTQGRADRTHPAACSTPRTSTPAWEPVRHRQTWKSRRACGSEAARIAQSG